MHPAVMRPAASAPRLSLPRSAVVRRVPVPRLALIAVALWAAAQVLTVCAVLPDELRERLAVWKNALGIAFFLLSTLVCPRAIRPNRVALLALIFPLHAAFRLWPASGFENPLPILYLAWWWGFFVAVPAAFRRRELYRPLMASILAATLLATAVGVLLGLANEQVYWWDHERVVFSFTNPIYFAYGGLASSVAAFVLVPASSRRIRLACWVVVVLGVSIVLGARARNAVLFGLTFVVVYVIAEHRQRFVSGTLGGLVAVALAVALGAELWGRLDELSSRRLTLWGAVVEENVGELSVADVLVGVGDFQQNVLVSHDEVVAAARFSRPHADNAYLDLFLSLGLVGVASFVLPLMLVGRDLLAALGRHRNVEWVRSDARTAVAVLAGLLVQGVVVSNVPSLGNLMNVCCMTLVMAVWGGVSRTTGRVARARR